MRKLPLLAFILLLILWASAAFAALPSSVTASGAGTAADNIVYTLSAGVDANGNKFYRNATSGRGIVWAVSTSDWRLNTNVLTGGAPIGSDDYGNLSGAITTFPLTGWIGINGTAPVPTFSSGGGGGTTRRHTAQWSFIPKQKPAPKTASLSGDNLIWLFALCLLCIPGRALIMGKKTRRDEI